MSPQRRPCLRLASLFFCAVLVPESALSAPDDVAHLEAELDATKNELADTRAALAKTQTLHRIASAPMGEIAQTSDRRTWVRRLRLAALLALIAAGSATLVPLAHVAIGHAGDCRVCDVLAHGGGGTADLVAAPSVPYPALLPELAHWEDAGAVPLRDLLSPCARGPPSISVPA